MTTKRLFFACVLLTVCTTWSQESTAPLRPTPDTTDLRPISFPFWMVREIALDLEEKQRLEQELQLLFLEQETLERLVSGLEQKDHTRQLQLELLGKNRDLLAVQLQAERETSPKEPWMAWGLRLLGALGAGFLLGRL